MTHLPIDPAPDPRLDEYDFYLPPEQIAQSAVEPRDSSRLLVIHRTGDGKVPLEQRTFRDLPDYLRPGDCLVLNETRVIPARLHGQKADTGGAVELLLLRRLDATRWRAMVGGKRLTVGVRLTIRGAPLTATITEVGEDALRVVAFSEPLEPYLSAIGEAPLPPYIRTPILNPERYQTVFARESGSAAAPTAGLHFTPELLARIEASGVGIVRCLLHVGLGTFLPVTEEQISARRLHQEYAELSPTAAAQINATRRAGGRVVAVGTTTTRTLESAALRAIGMTDTSGAVVYNAAAKAAPEGETVIPFQGETALFIVPGFRFRAVDALVTNFHLPKSSLLMLVSAFAGRETIRHAYETAIREGYRFYSLGDACLIL